MSEGADVSVWFRKNLAVIHDGSENAIDNEDVVISRQLIDALIAGESIAIHIAPLVPNDYRFILRMED